MRKPSVFIVFLALVWLAGLEIPELTRLNDDTSNDFAVSACERQYVHRSAAGAEKISLTDNDFVQTGDLQTFQDSPSPIGARFSILIGQDLLLLYSVHRT
jgi:hypothetical protein